MKEKDYAGARRYAEYTFTNEDKATLATYLSKYKYKDLAMRQKNMAATYAVDKLLTEAGIEHSKPNLKFGKIKIGKFTYVIRATARCVHFVKGYYSRECRSRYQDIKVRQNHLRIPLLSQFLRFQQCNLCRGNGQTGLPGTGKLSDSRRSF